MSLTYKDLAGIDRELGARGVLPMFPRWQTEAAAFLASGARRWIVRAARGSAKSHTLCKIGVAETLFADVVIPPGERFFWTHTSVTKPEAAARLAQYAFYFDALGVPYTRADDVLLLVNMPRGIRVTAATVTANSGWRSYGYAQDEAAKFRTSDGAMNGGEVDASIKATTVTVRGARGYVFSSAWSCEDHHYALVEAGTTPEQYVTQGTTWEFNTTITEEDTHRLEPDHKTWAREYGNVPSSSADSSLLSLEEVRGATRASPIELPPGPGFYVAAMDPAMRIDAWSLVVFQAIAGKVKVALVRWWKSRGSEPLNPTDILLAIRRNVAPFGSRVPIYTDQASADAIIDIGSRIGLRIISRAWTASNKLSAAERLRTMVANGTLELPPMPEVERDLLGIRRIVQPGGTIQIRSPRDARGHGDIASALMLGLDFAACAEAHGARAARDVARADAAWEQLDARGLGPGRPSPVNALSLIFPKHDEDYPNG